MGEVVETSLGHRPAGERWSFDDGVTRVFEDMLERSIPQYDVMRRTCFELGRQFVKTDGNGEILDLGASRGGSVAPFVEAFGSSCRYVLVEVSEPMRAALSDRFSAFTGQGAGPVRVLGTDLRLGLPPCRADLVLSILTVQFVPIEYRMQLLRRVWENMRPGGAFLFVEKILGASARIDDEMVRRYLDMKRANGYTEDEVARKRLSLEGVLVPVTARMNEEFLRGAGFRQIDCFWRWLNFAGWIAIKD